MSAAALSRRAPEPPLPATAFLVEAVARHRMPNAPSTRVSLEARVGRVLDIFERLERADQIGW